MHDRRLKSATYLLNLHTWLKQEVCHAQLLLRSAATKDQREKKDKRGRQNESVRITDERWMEHNNPLKTNEMKRNKCRLMWY